MKYFLTFCIAIAIALSISTSTFTSCNKEPEIDTSRNHIRGLWGKVEGFNEYGEPLGLLNDVQIVVRIMGIDTLITTTTGKWNDEDGKWEGWRLRGNPQGYYTIEILKEGFGKNQIFRRYFSATRADTLPTMYLAKQPQGSIALDDITLTGNVLNISRTIFFVGTRSYALSAWYFFDTTANVSNENNVYAYMAGAKNSDGKSSNTMTIKKPLDNLYSSGIREGQQVYVRAYADNYKYVRFEIDSAVWVYPNITEGSNVLNFTMPPMNED
ncbi:MAG: hypothetical protein FWC39_03195 [Bacteroidetes bacterium]|nr:hypothetical protein [Bacteroidota bacterium]